MGFCTHSLCNRCRSGISPRIGRYHLIRMHESPSSLDRFVRRVYRRLVVLRLLEWSGLGFAAACVTSLISILLLRNQHESLFLIGGAQLGLGTLMGLIAALLRRPRMIDAAVEADRQLN